MNDEALLAELEAVAEKLKVEVVYDRFTGDAAGTGGICKVRGTWRVIVERRCNPGERLSVLALALARFDMEEVFLSPSLRSLLERYKPQSAAEETAAAEPEVAAAEPEVATVPEVAAAEPEVAAESEVVAKPEGVAEAS